MSSAWEDEYYAGVKRPPPDPYFESLPAERQARILAARKQSDVFTPMGAVEASDFRQRDAVHRAIAINSQEGALIDKPSVARGLAMQEQACHVEAERQRAYNERLKAERAKAKENERVAALRRAEDVATGELTAERCRTIQDEIQSILGAGQ